MPWDSLTNPSIQLGIVKAVLSRAGISATNLFLNLRWMSRLVLETERDRTPITMDDYADVAGEYYPVGLGDWLFAVPPFAPASEERDQAYLAYLREKGIQEDVIARALQMRRCVPAFLDDCCGLILERAPRIVGFTTMFSQTVASLVLAQRLKELDPSLVIVFGGACCDGPMGAGLHRAFPVIDVVIRGKSEHVVAPVFHDLLAGGPVRPQPGLCYRVDGDSVTVEPVPESFPMSEVPVPCYDDFFAQLAESPLEADVSARVSLPFETARGCWWGAKAHCTFCGLNAEEMNFRSKPPQMVLEDLMALSSRYRRLDFFAVDNILDMHYFQSVLPPIANAGAQFKFFFETKSNLKREHVRAMSAAGVRSINPGIETFSNSILSLMRKGVTALQNIRLLKWCAEYGIWVKWNLLYGFPREEPEEYDRIAEIASSLFHLQPPDLNRLHVDRFSPYQVRPGDHGIRLVGPQRFYPLVYPADPASLQQIAYAFEFEYLDGRDPELYVAGLRRLVTEWKAAHAAGRKQLSYRRGPGFLRITDRRANTPPAEYTLDGTEALIYEACDAGARPAAIASALDTTLEEPPSAAEIAEFLDELVDLRLVYRERDRYLALATAERTRDHRMPLVADEDPMDGLVQLGARLSDRAVG